MNVPATPSTSIGELLAAEDFDELDAILDDLRTRDDETPQWEFCEGVMAALVCCRRPVPQGEYLPVLLGTGDDGVAPFADVAQRERFLALWERRWREVATSLDAEVESLEDEAAYHPEVMDVRGAVAALPAEERDVLGEQELPSFAQVWALGFMYVVENWPEEWAPPRDKDSARWLDSALQAIVAMTENDEGVPEIAPGDDLAGAIGDALERMGSEVEISGDKVTIYKMKRRKGYQKWNGHRQQFSKIQIESINNLRE